MTRRGTCISLSEIDRVEVGRRLNEKEMIADDIDVNRPLDHFGPTWIFEEIFTIARAHTKLTQQKNYKSLKTTRKQINARKR